MVREADSRIEEGWVGAGMMDWPGGEGKNFDVFDK